MIIGIMGPARSGKDTMALHLCKKFGFVRIALADEIKRIQMRLYDMSEEQLWGDNLKEVPDLRYPIPGKGHMTPRIGAQVIGTEVVRGLYQDTWVRLVRKYSGSVLSGSHYYEKTQGVLPTRRFSRLFSKRPAGIVVPDVRFWNEIKGIHEEGGVVVRLKRVGAITGQVGIKGHASEEEQKQVADSEVDFVLEVPEGISTYQDSIDKLFERIPKVPLRRLRQVA